MTDLIAIAARALPAHGPADALAGHHGAMVEDGMNLKCLVCMVWPTDRCCKLEALREEQERWRAEMHARLVQIEVEGIRRLAAVSAEQQAAQQRNAIWSTSPDQRQQDSYINPVNAFALGSVLSSSDSSSSCSSSSDSGSSSSSSCSSSGGGND